MSAYICPPTAAALAARRRCAGVPAQALRDRLRLGAGQAAWAAYLPKGFAVDCEGDAAASRHLEELCAQKLKGCELPREEAAGARPSAACAPRSAASSPARSPSLASTTCDDLASSPAGSERSEPEEAAAAEPPTAASLAGRVWQLSRQPAGCRLVQRALDEARSDEEREALAGEIQGHVWDALRCPHANHVLQRCIATLKPSAAQFILDEIRAKGQGAAAQAARHRFGCRVLERLLEQCSRAQLHWFEEDLLRESLLLANHPFGNYVVAHLLEWGEEDIKRRVIEMLQLHVASAGTDDFLGAVLAKALAHGPEDARLALARAVAAAPGLLMAMARLRHGHVAALLALRGLGAEPAGQRARDELRARAAELRASRYGRFVAAGVCP